MEISFFDSVLPWFRGVGVSKRRTQAATLVLRLMGRCASLKRPCTGPCLEGRAKKDISVLFSPVSFLGGPCLTLPFYGTNIEQKTPVKKAQNTILNRAPIFTLQQSKIEWSSFFLHWKGITVNTVGNSPSWFKNCTQPGCAFPRNSWALLRLLRKDKGSITLYAHTLSKYH